MIQPYATRQKQLEDIIRRALRGLPLSENQRDKLRNAMFDLALVGGWAERDRTLEILRRFEQAGSSDARSVYQSLIEVSIQEVLKLPITPDS